MTNQYKENFNHKEKEIYVRINLLKEYKILCVHNFQAKLEY